jgi:hypothetical protein
VSDDEPRKTVTDLTVFICRGYTKRAVTFNADALREIRFQPGESTRDPDAD